MKDDLNEDKQISKKAKGRKRRKRIEDSEPEQTDEMKKNSLKKILKEQLNQLKIMMIMYK